MKMLKTKLLRTVLLSILTVVIVAACGQSSASEAPSSQADIPLHSVEPSGSGLPDSASIFKAPSDIQELVNRSDAVVITTISSISDTKSKVFGDPSDAAAMVAQGRPEPRIEETQYELSVEEVLLDDDSIGALGYNPNLALLGTHGPHSPQKGERIMFALLARPVPGLYSLVANWSLIPLDGGPIRNFDGKDPGYAGVTDEASLKAAVIEAASNHAKSPPSEWPTLFD